MELEQCFNFVLTKAQQVVHHIFKIELAPYGVTPGQYAVLKCLWDQNGQTATQLASRLSLDGSTMTGILDRMELKGFITKQPDVKDRRALHVLLTEKGRSLEGPLSEAIMEANKRALVYFDSHQADQLNRMLREITAHEK